jgi:hypothetical protein
MIGKFTVWAQILDWNVCVAVAASCSLAGPWPGGLKVSYLKKK